MAKRKIDEKITEEESVKTKSAKTKTTSTKSTTSRTKKEVEQEIEEKPKKTSRKKVVEEVVEEKPKTRSRSKAKAEEPVIKPAKETKSKKTTSKAKKVVEEIIEEEKPKKVAKSSKTKKAETKEKPKRASKKKEADEEEIFFYGDDDDDVIESDIVDDEDELEDVDPDAITEEELELANELDLEEFEKFEEEENKTEGKKVFKSSDHAEKVRKHFIEICDKFNSGDENLRHEAIEEAIEELKSFVHYVIKKKYSTYGKYYEDLVQEGMVGIIKGLEKYNPHKSMPTTFFNLYIIHEMSKYIDTEVNKTTSHYSSNLTRINRVIDKFEQQGRKWNETDIAVETGLNMETVIQCLHIKEYKNEMYYETDEILEANISEHSDSPEQQFVKNERMAILYKSIGTLLPEEIQVLKYRYGLLGAQTISYKEIAKEMGVSIEKVRKYRHDAIKKLRHKSAMRSVFKDYINESENATITETDIAIIPDDMINNQMKELEEIDFDFSVLDE